MNILYIRPFLENGGATAYILQLAEGLSARGHKSVAATCGGEQQGRMARFGIVYDRIPLSPSTPFHWAAALPAILRIVRREQIDLINTHHRFAALVGKSAARLARIPFVSTMQEIKGNRGRLTRLGLGNQMITLSTAIKQHIITNYQMPADQISVIPMGVEIPPALSSQQRTALIQSIGLDGRAPIIACIGRLSSEKGQIYLLQAIPAVLASYPNAQFLFVGEGPDRPELEARAAQLGLTANLFFLGWRNDVQDLIGLADFLVVPSLTEGLGIVIIEAFAQKKSAIATNVGGILDIVTPQENGILVPAGNSSEISEAVISFLRNPAQVSTFAQKGYELVNKHFSKQKMIEQTEVLFQSLVDKNALVRRTR
jgi:glycosyltransferase involved in cell wall biosynthesis